MSRLKEAVRDRVETPYGKVTIYRLDKLEELGVARTSRIPYSIRILLENVVRNLDDKVITEDDLKILASWSPSSVPEREVPFMPARVLLQDATGVPLIVDLAAMRSAVRRFGKDPRKVNPVVPVDLVIDHSVEVDYYGTSYAISRNMCLEVERNKERYSLLKWAQASFDNLRVIPPGKGIIHQINIEYLAKVVDVREHNGELVVFPDTLIGTDSHTTMVNGIGVLGWGVGGIEAEAVMLGQPYYIKVPEVVGVRLVGEPPEGVTSTDVVLTVTELLRRKDVVGKFVEFFGPSLKLLTGFDRTVVSNMAPEYGATVGYFPIDERTLSYLRATGRDPKHVELVEKYARLNMLFYDEAQPEPEYTEMITLDLSTLEPSIAGPRNPDERIPVKRGKRAFLESLEKELAKTKASADVRARVNIGGGEYEIGHGFVAIAAITSCTNTSNPAVMIGAGLLAKKAVERGLKVKPYVKTSLAPGSRAVTEYLARLGLLPYLEALGFHVVGYGCTTCIGNSGPLPKPVEEAIRKYGLISVAVLSGNRPYEGRIHPLAKFSYIMSPMLVVAYALAGRMDIDFEEEPLGYDPNGEPVYLRDIWPKMDEIRNLVEKALDPELFRSAHADVLRGTPEWDSISVAKVDVYQWDPNSTYIQEPPWLKDIQLEPPPLQDIKGARVLLLLGDKITTDHISPAGKIPPDSPAGRCLVERGVPLDKLHSYIARRGAHEVMVRGGFFHPRLRNFLVDVEGGWTVYIPSGEVMPVYDAAMRYLKDDTPLIILAGKQYGSGSSRDWAAKATVLLGVRAVIAESFERIHRSNLIAMGVLPLQFKPGESWRSLGLTGREVFDILGISEGLTPRKELKVVARREDGSEVEFKAIARLDTWIEVEYYKHGGVLPYVFRRMVKE